MIRDISEAFVSDRGLWEYPVPGKKLHITHPVELASGHLAMMTFCRKGGDAVPWSFVLEQYCKAPKATMEEIERYVCKRCMQGLDMKMEVARIFQSRPRPSKNVTVFRKVSGSRG